MKSKHIFLAILLTLIYSLCYVLIKAGLAYAPPLLFGGLRTLIAGAALLAYAFSKCEPLFPPKTRWKGLLVLAFVGTTLVFGAMFLSPGLAGAGIASVLGNSQALITVVLAALFLGERLTTGKTTAVILGLSGAILIAFPALKASNTESVLGIGLALAVSAGTATGNVIVKRYRIKRGLLAFAGWQLVLGSLPLLFFSALSEHGQEVTWNMAFAGILLFLAVVETSFPTAAWYWLVQQEDVGQLSLFFFLVPIFGLGLAALIFNEAINLYEGTGIVAILAGIGALIWEASHTPVHAYTYCPFCNTKVTIYASASAN
jgi:drug/metabolite transporter (DMT)-like permease